MDKTSAVPFVHEPLKDFDYPIWNKPCTVEIKQTTRTAGVKENITKEGQKILEINNGFTVEKKVEFIPLYPHMRYEISDEHNLLTGHLTAQWLTLYWSYEAGKAEIKKSRRVHHGDQMILYIYPLSEREMVQSIRVDRDFKYRVILYNDIQ